MDDTAYEIEMLATDLCNMNFCAVAQRDAVRVVVAGTVGRFEIDGSRWTVGAKTGRGYKTFLKALRETSSRMAAV